MANIIKINMKLKQLLILISWFLPVTISGKMTMLATFGCREFQDHNDGLSAHWDVSGDPCPIEKFEWAIHKFDGTVVLNMTQLPAGRWSEMSHK